MTTHATPWEDGTPCWVDRAVVDLKGAVGFYRRVLGWTAFDTGARLAHYTRCRLGERDVAALLRPMPGIETLPWTVYFASSDTEKTLELVAEHGGTLLVGPMVIPGVGTMALVTDPFGALVGVWQTAGMIGFGVTDEPGSVGWVQGWYADADGARAFYRDVFGLQDGPEAGTVALPGTDRPVAGIGALGDSPAGGSSSHWIVHFLVDDLAAATGRATAAGAELISAATDTTTGRSSVFRDPTGALFALLEH